MNDTYQSLQNQFRESMARLASSVCIVTTKGDAGMCGMTVTAVCSITDTPATVMVCINRKSAMNAVFRNNGIMCINVLAADQQELAMQFAGKTELEMAERFNNDAWDTSERLPRLVHAAATLHGNVFQTTDIGTHTVFFVTISGISLSDDPSALVYFSRAFHGLEQAGDE